MAVPRSKSYGNASLFACFGYAMLIRSTLISLTSLLVGKPEGLRCYVQPNQ